MYTRTNPPLPPPISLWTPESEHLNIAEKNRPDVYVIPDSRTPILHATLFIPVGVARDTVPGLSNFVAQLAASVNRTQSSEAVAAAIENLGASFGAGVDMDFISFSVSVLSKYADEALSVVGKCLFSPAFPNEEIERVRKRTIAQIDQLQVDGEYLAMRAFSEAFYGSHPYSASRRGTAKSLANIDESLCQRQIDIITSTSGACVIFSGDVDAETADRLVRTHFSQWIASEESTFPPLSHIDATVGKNIVLKPKSDALQSSIIFGFNGIDRKDADFPLLSLLTTVVGGGLSSRLNSLLREEHGFTYGASCYADDGIYGTTVLLHTEVGTDVTIPAFEDILSVIRRINSEAIPENELELKKQYLLGSIVRGSETPRQRAAQVQLSHLYGLPKDYFVQYGKIISGATSQALLKIAQRVFSEENFTAAVCGNTDVFSEGMHRYGDVSIL